MFLYIYVLCQMTSGNRKRISFVAYMVCEIKHHLENGTYKYSNSSMLKIGVYSTFSNNLFKKLSS